MDEAIRNPGASLADAVAAADRQLDVPAAVLATPALERGDDLAPAGRFVLFSIASTHYAVSQTFVTELEPVPNITLVPRMPAWLRGVTNLRGDILSVIDLRTFLGLEATSPRGRRMLVVRLLDEAFSAGLLVDAVDRIATVPLDEITPPASSFDGPLAEYLTGVFLTGTRLVAVLDLDRLLRSSEIRQFDEPQDVAVGA